MPLHRRAPNHVPFHTWKYLHSPSWIRQQSGLGRGYPCPVPTYTSRPLLTQQTRSRSVSMSRLRAMNGLDEWETLVEYSPKCSPEPRWAQCFGQRSTPASCPSKTFSRPKVPGADSTAPRPCMPTSVRTVPPRNSRPYIPATISKKKACPDSVQTLTAGKNGQ